MELSPAFPFFQLPKNGKKLKFNAAPIYSGLPANKRSISCALLIIIILSGLFLALTVHFSRAQTGTSVNGIISSNATWTQAGSPYTFTGPVAVNKGVTLTIQTGVTVNIGSYYLQVNGTLVAIGTKTNPIQFQSNIYGDIGITFMPSSISWNQQAAAGCIIKNAILTLSVEITNASPLIDSDNITISGGTAILASGSPIISNNIINIQGSIGDQDEGIDLNNQGSPIISNNTICDLYGESFIGQGIVIDNTSGSTFPFGNTTISGNSISGWATGIQTGYNTTVEGNLVFNNDGWTDDGAGIAISPAGTGNFILNNTVINNPYGMIVDYPATISGNNIYYNNKYNVEDSTCNVNATHNWWGTTDTKAINQTIYDFKDNFNLGNVSFVPFLDSPNTQAPTFVNASAGTGGSISPSGIIRLNHGASQTFTITPNTGYHIVNVLVNSASVGAVSSYSVKNVNGATTISAIFAPNPTPTSSPSATPSPASSTSSSSSPTATPTVSPSASPSQTPATPELPSVIFTLIVLMAASIAIVFCIRKSKGSA